MHGLLWYSVALAVCFEFCSGQVTRKDQNILSRKRRYLLYPTGSNFVITMSYVKSVTVLAPRGINTLGECDVPFPLPSDPSLLRKYKRPHYRQRREILDRLENAFNELDFNGNACVKRMLCEAREFIPVKGKSLVKDLLSAIFSLPEIERTKDDKYADFCHNSTFTDCSVPLINLLVGEV